MDKRRYTITPVTGVHIGTGEELTPLEYQITSTIGGKKIKPAYLKFSGERILQRLFRDDKEELSKFELASAACGEGNILELYKFFHTKCDFNDLDYYCDFTKGFLETYNAILKGNPNQEKDPKKKKDPLKNAGIVLQMYRTEGTKNPVIPGSSIKGAIRTALLNNYLKKLPPEEYRSKFAEFEDEQEEEKIKKDDKFKKFENDLKNRLFEYTDAKKDPLRAVLFSDCSFKADKTQLVGRLNNVTFDRQNKKLDPKKMQIQAEVLRGGLFGGEAEAELCITINDKLQETPFSLQPEEKQECIKKIAFEDIHESCNNFYWKEFKNEYDTFYKDVDDGSEEFIFELFKKLQAAKDAKGQFIIRVGRWSQVEFVTFEKEFRKPKTRIVKGKELPYGTTRTLFDYNGKYAPMGWCILTEKE